MILLIKNGHVINPATETDEVADILAEDGKVVKMEKNIKDKADYVIDAKGCYVMPGFIDMHVHLRDPGQEQKETIETGCNAAAHGGYTTILAMPNTKPVVDNPDVVKYVQNKAKTVGVVNVLQVGAITKGQQGKELADIRGMYEAGIPAISEDGRSVMNSELYREAMEIAAELDIPVLAHCEDINLVNGGVMNEDAHSKELGLRGITNSVEDIIVARDIMLSGDTGAKLHLCHCSTKDSVKMIRIAKKDGVSVSAEVCPHHFAMTEDEIAGDDANYKMNPPLRSAADVEALVDGLADGTMEAISTDHAPHGEEEKKQSIAKAPFGIVGSETAYALSVTHLVKTGKLTPLQLVEKMSTNPCRILSVPGGTLSVGAPADITIADMDSEYVIDKNTFLSKGKNTPFDGAKVNGRVYYTIVGGNIVYQYE